MKLLYIFLFLVTLVVADSDKHEYEEHYFPLDMNYLELSEKQHKQVKKIIKEFRHEYKDFHSKESSVHQKISQLFLEKEFNTEKFIRLSSDLNEQSIQIQAKFFSQMHMLLTPDQKKRFVKYMQEWKVE